MRVSVPLAALALAGTLLAAGRPAAAQQVTSPTQAPQFTVRAGGYFINDSGVRHNIGSSYLAAGLDYDLHDVVDTSRTILSVDYVDRSSSGNSLRIFPVTIGQLILGSSGSGVQTYYGVGAGAYFTHSDFNGGNKHDNVLFGGYAGAGLIYNRFLELDLRYHLVTSQNGINPGGLEVTAGVRF